MKFLIFSESSSGHHLEYLKHEISFANNCYKHMFFFVLPSVLESEVKQIKISKVNNNIHFEYIPSDLSDQLKNMNRLKKSYILSNKIRQYYKKFEPDKLILNEISSKLPFLTFLLHKKSLIRGIIYKIPRYKVNVGILKKYEETLIYKLLSKSNTIDTIWLLNDEESSKFYNHYYETSHFKNLPDPINCHDSFNDDIINAFKDENRIILFHGGGMGERKGTREIIEAFRKMSDEQLNKFILIFAGRINNEDERAYMEEFTTEYSSKIKIVKISNFLSFKDLCSYIKVSDYVLIPYKNTEQSSGFLGYAAYYNKCVIGPSEGLLGQLIINNNLGLTIQNIDSENLRETILKLSKSPAYINSRGEILTNYVTKNSIQAFTNTIFIED